MADSRHAPLSLAAPGTSPAPHRLAPLFTPRSIAVVGASRRRNSSGNDVLRDQVLTDFDGAVYPVNPRYERLYGWPCHPSLRDVPGPIDLAVLAVPNHVLQATLADTIKCGARAAVIFASGSVPEDMEPKLAQRLAAMATEARLPILGPNCMGFYNLEHRLRAFSLHYPRPLAPGGITYVTQAGATMMPLLFNDPRLRYNIAASTGLEVSVTLPQVMDYALSLPSTRVIALMLETIRDPDAFVAALEKAAAKGVPVVVLKLGRSEAAARLAVSHTGAIAGDDKVYDAVFRRYGLLRVRDMGELAATAMLLSHHPVIGAGGLAAILDSGGERELLLDLAEDIVVPFARINERTTELIRRKLDYGLEPVNPLDAWGAGKNVDDVVETCFGALMADPDTALGMFVTDFTDGIDLHETYVATLGALVRSTPKPIVAMTNFSAWSHRDFATRLDGLGIPVFDGPAEALVAIRQSFAYRDFQQARGALRAGVTTAQQHSHWRERLAGLRDPLAESEGYALLADYGLPVPRHHLAMNEDEAIEAGRRLGWPVVLKTAAPGVAHKSDVDGVALGLADENTLRQAYQDMRRRLGAQVLVVEHLPADAELALGLHIDPGFGPFVMVASGGLWIEMHGDARLLKVPVAPDEALAAIRALKIAPLLGGARGRRPVDPGQLAQLLVCLSDLAVELSDVIGELDINPIRISGKRITVADTLVVPRNRA